jgi:hypothetical protein
MHAEREWMEVKRLQSCSLQEAIREAESMGEGRDGQREWMRLGERE